MEKRGTGQEEHTQHRISDQIIARSKEITAANPLQTMDWLLRFSQSFLMPQRPARLQYALLALVVVLAFTHVYLGTARNFENLAHGQDRVTQPFYGGNLGNTLTLALPEAKAAGLNEGDTILTINSHPFTGGAVLLEQVRQSKPGQPLTVTFHPHDAQPQAPPSTAAIVLRPERTVPASLYAWVIKSIFFLLPLFCLLTGLYVVFARPRNVFAWLILGILAYFEALFIPGHQFYSPLLAVAMFWSTLAQTAMPLCLMAFGIYFPERSQIDIRYPWIKWLFIVPVVVLFPIDLLYAYDRSYNFAAGHWLIPYLSSINAIEAVSEAGAILYFFLNLSPKLRTATGDARRRLRILYVGSAIGLTPFAILVIRSIFYKTDVGQNVSQWIIIASFGTLLLFPLSLAYVVVVQRAMDLRILIRQGTRYALARQSINIVRILLALWLSLSMVDLVGHPGHQRNVDVVRIFGIVGIFFVFRFRLFQTPAAKNRSALLPRGLLYRAAPLRALRRGPQLHRSRSSHQHHHPAPRAILSTSTASPSSFAPVIPFGCNSPPEPRPCRHGRMFSRSPPPPPPSRPSVAPGAPPTSTEMIPPAGSLTPLTPSVLPLPISPPNFWFLSPGVTASPV